LCMALLVATAGQLQAAVITINLAAAGTNSVNITGLNAGKTFGSTRTDVPSFVGNDKLTIRGSSNTLFYRDDTVIFPDTVPSFSPDFGPNSFIGFRFASLGGFKYGYIEVLWNWTGTPSTSSFQLLSAAYEDQANTAIVTPAGSVVPEPTSMAIFGLGALGMAYRARRKSKA